MGERRSRSRSRLAARRQEKARLKSLLSRIDEIGSEDHITKWSSVSSLTEHAKYIVCADSVVPPLCGVRRKKHLDLILLDRLKQVAYWDWKPKELDAISRLLTAILKHLPVQGRGVRRRRLRIQRERNFVDAAALTLRSQSEDFKEDAQWNALLEQDSYRYCQELLLIIETEPLWQVRIWAEARIADNLDQVFASPEEMLRLDSAVRKLGLVNREDPESAMLIRLLRKVLERLDSRNLPVECAMLWETISKLAYGRLSREVRREFKEALQVHQNIG